MKDRLLHMVLERSFLYSSQPTFRLTSGKMSSYYFNLKPVTLDPEGMYLIGNIIFKKIKHLSPDAIGGMSFGADPIAIATSLISHIEGKPIKAFSVRKEKKEHGAQKLIEGNVEPGSRVVIVEDVTTTGGSAIRACEAARANSFKIVKVLVIVDREEGGRQAILEHASDYEAILTRSEIMELWTSRQRSRR
jgi:orotate phosphoribosyltransferase